LQLKSLWTSKENSGGLVVPSDDTPEVRLLRFGYKTQSKAKMRFKPDPNGVISEPIPS
jgi:hypothetical protein